MNAKAAEFDSLRTRLFEPNAANESILDFGNENLAVLDPLRDGL